MIDRSSRGPSATRALRVICLASLAALATGCASKGDKADRPDNPFRPGSEVGPSGATPQTEEALKAEAALFYRRAHEAMVASDYETATTRYTQLIARYPFTEYSTQAELEKIFVQYRSFAPDEALLAADRFIREHPRHVHADYVQYLKGLINSSRTQAISDYLPIDSSKKDVTGERRAYDDFAVLLQRYPSSPYAGDARKRMVYLRNRVASHELSIVRYYVKRQAWVAVSKRAENLIAEYPGAPATVDALKLLKLSYEKLGLTPQVADLDLLIASNAESIAQASAPPPKPGPRTVIVLPTDQPSVAPAALAPAAAATPAAPAAALELTSEAPQGFFERIGGYFESLNKTYTIDSKETRPADAAAAGTAAAPAVSTRAEPANPSSANQPDAASLTTGPYVGEPAAINLPPLFSAGEAAKPAQATTETAPKVEAAAPATAATPEEKKEKGGLFDFLNKTYTIGGSKTDEAAAKNPPATTSEATPSDSNTQLKMDYEAPDGSSQPVTVNGNTTPEPQPAAPPATP
ncbi:outer membrane protein assembly factor BamD [uncultured Nevskia sp.]|uniref:outer membrane protein assembly factor BamD n=1 Tax=uncultured Nevskia sp. TaxID=228950 RepID=UPI0025F39CA8|nr:outer membrane protein assembly factor BamD [uncultured Nevskia sp.]